MDKIKNVFNPGHNEVDDLLYDTGKDSKKHRTTASHDQPTGRHGTGTGSGSGIDSTTKPNELGNHQTGISERTSNKDHTGNDAAIGAGAGGAAVASNEQYGQHGQYGQQMTGHEQYGQYGQQVTGHEQYGQYGQYGQPTVGHEHEKYATENQTSHPHDSETAKSTGTHQSSLLNKLDPRVKSDPQKPTEEAQQKPNAAQKYAPIAAAGAGAAGVAAHEHHRDQHTDAVEHESSASKTTETHKKGLFSKLDPRHKSDHQKPAAAEDHKSTRDHAPMAVAGAGTSSAAVEKHQKHNQSPAAQAHESSASETTEPHKRGLLAKLDPRHKSDHHSTEVEEQKKPAEYAPIAAVGAGVAGAAVHEHHKHDNHQADEKKESAASKTTEPHKSSLLNRLDPRVNSDHKNPETEDHTVSKSYAPVAAVGTGAGAAGVVAHEHHNHKEQPAAFYEPYENRSSVHEHHKHHENSSSGHTQHKLHKEPPHRNLRASSIAQESVPVTAVGADTGVAAHDHHSHDQNTAIGEQQSHSGHHYAPQVAAGAGLAGVTYAAHEHDQPGRSSSTKAQGDNVGGATIMKPRLLGNADAASYDSSAPSYASNASIKSGVQGRAPIAMGGMLLHGQRAADDTSTPAPHEDLPKVQATGGKFMNEDVAKEAGYPHDQSSSISHGPAVLTSAGAASAAYALHRNYKDGESHDSQAALVPTDGNTSGPAALTSAGAASAAYALHRNHKDGESHDSQAAMVRNKDNASGPASKTIGPHKSNIANIIDPRVKPVPELMRGNGNKLPTDGDTSGPASRTIGPHEGNVANIVDPRVKPVPELMRRKNNTTVPENSADTQSGHHHEPNTSAKRDESTTSKSSILGKIVSKVKSNPDSTKDAKHTTESSSATYTDTNRSVTKPEPVLGVSGVHKTSSNGKSGTTDSPSSPSSPKEPIVHKNKILNFLDPRVKSDKSKTVPDADVAHNQSTTENIGSNESDGAPEHTPTISSGAGIGDFSNATATAKGVGIAPTSKPVDSQNVPTNTTSGLIGRQETSEHTNANNAADGKGGVLTGEKAKRGDPSNPYSAEPLDPRVDMPGKYPESSTDLSK